MNMTTLEIVTSWHQLMTSYLISQLLADTFLRPNSGTVQYNILFITDRLLSLFQPVFTSSKLTVEIPEQ